MPYRKRQKRCVIKNLKIHGNGKKTVTWHTTFGEISVIEPLFRGPGQQFRPFLTAAEITSRCCSMPLQRAMTDFGADHAFGQVPSKWREHYGIEMPDSTIRKVTEFHAQQMHAQQEDIIEPLKSNGCAVLVAEIDGCMLPIVTIGEEDGDKRKPKTWHWQEARLALAHEQGRATPQFAATFGGRVAEAGQALRNGAVAAGFGTQTQLHSVGDGATWIAEQVERQFGAQGHYWVDFYHVCEYLGAAAPIGAPAQSHAWTETQKQLLKNNDYHRVIDNLTHLTHFGDLVGWSER